MAMKVKKRPAVVTAALSRFIDLVRDIPEVEYVALPAGGPPEIFTFITQSDNEVCYQVIAAEDVVIREISGAEIEFHVRFLNDHSIETEVEPAEIFYRAERNAEH